MDNRVGFIQWAIGENEVGWIGLAARIAETGQWQELILEYPKDLDKVASFLKQHTPTSDIYFCPSILIDEERKKENIQTGNIVYADLDECHPKNLLVPPTIVLETSHKRYQGFWKLDKKTSSVDIENINRRIAYYHEDEGSDIGGWDLSQLLRIPATKNFKRDDPEEVKIYSNNWDNVYSVDHFKMIYPEIKNRSFTDIEDVPFPEFLPETSPEEILDSVRGSVSARVWPLFEDPPQIDRSKNLWQLELMMFDVGLPKEDVFIVARAAACNKFNSDDLLWKDVLRAENFAHNKTKLLNLDDADIQEVDAFIPNESILTDEERKEVLENKTLIDVYMDWATTVTDAPPQYHVAAIFTVLSTLLSGSLRLPTSFGEIKPNLWFMLMGDTTTSRKSTAMDMAMDLINDVDPDALLATDGTMEGLVSALSLRPSRVSLFHRDEVSGLLDAMGKKDYNAGLLEMFTKLYDGKRMRRQLRKEIIDVQDPVLVLLTGGTKDGVLGALNQMHVASGFVPRFCFVISEPDPKRMRGLGPPNQMSSNARTGVLFELQHLYNEHNEKDENNPFGTVVKKNVVLTTDAWELYNRYEKKLLDIANASNIPNLMIPMMARLAISGLKAAVLVAATMMTDEVIVDISHIKKAFFYVNIWKNDAFEVVLNAGRTAQERELDLISQMIERAGSDGVKRSVIMQSRRLLARDAETIFNTLEQRGIITSRRVGRGFKYFHNKHLRRVGETV